MIWSAFKSKVRDHLHLFNRMHNVQTLIDANIKVAVMDLMSAEPLLRVRVATNPTLTALSDYCARALLPAFATVTDVFVQDGDEKDNFLALGLDQVDDMVKGLLNSEGRFAIYDAAKGYLYISPSPLDQNNTLRIRYATMSANFADEDEVLFNDRAALAVSEYVLMQLALKVARDPAAAQIHSSLHASTKRAYLGDITEAKLSGLLKSTDNSTPL